MPTLRAMVDGRTLETVRAASPAATHVAKHIQDPFGQTKGDVDDLNEARMNYEAEKAKMRMQLAPVEQVVQGIKNMHQLDGPGDGSPLDMSPNNPANLDPMTGQPYQSGPGQQIDESTGVPNNMSQTTGMMNSNRPSTAGFQPGVSPGPTESVRPPKMGMPQPGQSGSQVAGNPGQNVRMPSGWQKPGTGSNPQNEMYNNPAPKPKGNKSLPGAKGPGDPKVANRTKKAQSNFGGGTGRGIKVEVHADSLAGVPLRSNVDKYAGMEKLRTASMNGSHQEGCMCAACRKRKMSADGDSRDWNTSTHSRMSDKQFNRDRAKLRNPDKDKKVHNRGEKNGVRIFSDRTGPMQARDFSTKRRKSLAKSGAAMKDGSFPIINREDLKNAEHLVGMSKHPEAARRHIAQRKKALGLALRGKNV